MAWMIDGNKLKEKAVPLLIPSEMELSGFLPKPVQAVMVSEIESMLYRDGIEIVNAPTIEAAPVVHGRWIELPSMAPEYQCSECEQSYEWWEPSEAHYCPNCGAKMDGGVSDG